MALAVTVNITSMLYFHKIQKFANYATKGFQLLEGFAPRLSDQLPLDPAGGTAPGPHFFHLCHFPQTQSVWIKAIQCASGRTFEIGQCLMKTWTRVLYGISFSLSHGVYLRALQLHSAYCIIVIIAHYGLFIDNYCFKAHIKTDVWLDG